MNKLLPFLVFGILLAASCKKSGSGGNNGSGGSTGPTNSLKSLITITYDPSNPGTRLDSIIMNYSYDGQGRSTSISTAQYSLSPLSLQASDTVYYTYNTNSIVVGDRTNPTTYYLNAAGTLADSAHSTGGSGTNVTYYSYDANSYLLKQNLYSVSGGIYTLQTTDSFVIVNGNLMYQFQNGDTLATYTYSSQTATPVISDYLTTHNITGHSSTNLLTETVFLGLPITFAYTLDSKNRISIVTEKLGGVATDAVNTYIYN